MDPNNSAEGWGNFAPVYASEVTQKTAVAARHLINLVANLRPIDATSMIMDLGTGTGALALQVARAYPSSSILATDISKGMTDVLCQLHVSNIETRVLDAQEVISLGEGLFSHIFTAFMLQFVDDPEIVLSGIHKVLEPAGVVGIALWHENIAPFTIWENACRTIDPAYRNKSEYPSPNAWTKCEQLKHHMEAAHFIDIQVTDIRFPFDFPSAEAFVEFFFFGRNPSSEYVTQQWKGDKQAAIQAVAKLVREEYGNGQNIELHAILGVGRKR